VWWYFQLATIHAIYTILKLIVQYREKRMKPRINDYRSRINFITGPGKETLMFGATWFYDLVKDVVLPVMGLLSIPFCLHLALDVFDFEDLYNNIYHHNFVQLVNDSGADTFRLSFHGILILICLFFVFDRTLGLGLKFLYSQSNATDEYKISYSNATTRDSILFFGSSRALHHYVPSIFEKELGLPCYNAADWGIKKMKGRYTDRVLAQNPDF
jgi:hypothetical protein